MDELMYYVPRHLDDPAKLLWWDLDEFMTAIAGLAVGMTAGSLLLSLVCPIAGVMTLSRIKAGGGQGYLKRLFYWYCGGGLLGLQRTPPSHIREYIG
jgi:conjugal transfer pilus assembly protein TraL